MSSRLSALKFVANNKKSVGTMLLAFAISFMTIYLIYSIVICTVISDEVITDRFPRYTTYLDISDKTLGVDRNDYDSGDDYAQALGEKRDKLCEDLKAIDGVDDAYYTQVLMTKYQAILGMIGYEFPLVDLDKVEPYLEHLDAELIEGRLPEGDGEIVVDDVLMKNQGYKIGDWYDEDAYGKTFTIVGVMDAPYPTCAGTPMGGTNSGWYIVILNDSEHAYVEELLGEIGIELSPEDEYYDRSTYDDAMDEISGIMDGVVLAIMAVVMIFTALSVIIAYISLMRNRINEYCLYASIGYSRSEVYGMMLREMLIIIGGGLVLGAGLSLLGSYLLKTCAMEPLGLIGYIWYGKQFLRIVAAFVMIMGVLQIPVLITMSRIKTIDAIED